MSSARSARRSRATRPLSSAAFYILLALADEDRYGLGIIDEVELRTDGEIVLGPGTLYNAIKRMLVDGWIENVAGADLAADTDTRRRYYRITGAGRAQVEAEANRLVRLVEAARDKHLLRDRRRG